MVTSKTTECAFSSPTIGRSVLVKGGSHRHKIPKIGDLHRSDVRSDQGEMALEAFPGVPISAIQCHALFDVTLQTGMRTGWSGRARHRGLLFEKLPLPGVGFVNLNPARTRFYSVGWCTRFR